MEIALLIVGIALLSLIGAAMVVGVVEVMILVGKNIFGVEEEE